MADINMPQKSGKRKKQIPRIDFTPMVDLGFILITFFIYTTSLAKPNVIDVAMPSTTHTDKPTVYPEESTLTLIPVKDHLVYYYFGVLKEKEQLRKTEMINVRDLLLKKKKEAVTLPSRFSAEAHKLHVLLKPNSDCTYDDLVKLLDEMSIVTVPVYMIAEISEVEMEWIGK